MQTQPSNKLLLALQFWKGDKDQAMRLARFIADLQPGHCEIADFLFISRFDCPQDIETIKYVSRKFDVHHTVCRRRGVGWPGGCNELWFGACEHVYHSIESGKMPQYKAMFTFEADGVPLARNWISRFSELWDESKCYVAGALLDSPGIHINGNALFACDLKFLRWVSKTIGSCSATSGWDYYLSKAFKQWGWAAIPEIVSEWQTKTFPVERFEEEIRKGTLWHHGVKDASLLDMAKNFL